MDRAGKVLKILLIVVASAATIVLLFLKLSDLLCVLVVSIVLAYLLNKPLSLLNRRMSKPWPLVIVFGGLAAAAAIVGMVFVPLILRQLVDFANYLPKLLQFVDGLFTAAGGRYGEPIDGIIRQAYAGFSQRAAEWIGSMTVNLAHISYSWIGWALLFPFLTFYLLKDHAFFTGQIGYLIPLRFRGDLNLLYQSMDKALTQFFRGQLLAALVVASLDAAGFALVGLPNFLLLALICGLCNLIPYVGPFIGAVPVVLVSAVQGWRMLLFSLLVVFLVQQVDNMFVSPRIIGSGLRLHPLYIILAIIVSSSIFGAVGLIFALPGLIVLREIIMYIFHRRLYREHGNPPA